MVRSPNDPVDSSIHDRLEVIDTTEERHVEENHGGVVIRVTENMTYDNKPDSDNDYSSQCTDYTDSTDSSVGSDDFIDVQDAAVRTELYYMPRVDVDDEGSGQEDVRGSQKQKDKQSTGRYPIRHSAFHQSSSQSIALIQDQINKMTKITRWKINAKKGNTKENDTDLETGNKSWLVQVPISATALSSTSLFFIRPFHPTRVILYNILHHRYFEIFLILAVLCNCILISVSSPVNSSYIGDTINKSPPVYAENIYLDKPMHMYFTEILFAVLFTVEMILKMVVLGVVGHKGSYFRSVNGVGWNWLDFLCVVFNWAAIFASNFGNYSCLRLIRLLKSLKLLHISHTLNIVISAFLASFGPLIVILAVLLCACVIFSLIGVQMWGVHGPGDFQKYCRNVSSGEFYQHLGHCSTTSMENGYWGKSCPIGFECNRLSEFPLSPIFITGWNNSINKMNYSSDQGYNTFGNYVSFDNSAVGLLSSFTISTFDGWGKHFANVTYDTMGMISFLYYFFVIAICGYWIPSLCVAVCVDTLRSVALKADRKALYKFFDMRRSHAISHASKIRLLPGGECKKKYSKSTKAKRTKRNHISSGDEGTLATEHKRKVEFLKSNPSFIPHSAAKKLSADENLQLRYAFMSHFNLVSESISDDYQALSLKDLLAKHGQTPTQYHQTHRAKQQNMFSKSHPSLFNDQPAKTSVSNGIPGEEIFDRFPLQYAGTNALKSANSRAAFNATYELQTVNKVSDTSSSCVPFSDEYLNAYCKGTIDCFDNPQQQVCRSEHTPNNAISPTSLCNNTIESPFPISRTSRQEEGNPECRNTVDYSFNEPRSNASEESKETVLAESLNEKINPNNKRRSDVLVSNPEGGSINDARGCREILTVILNLIHMFTEGYPRVVSQYITLQLQLNEENKIPPQMQPSSLRRMLRKEVYEGNMSNKINVNTRKRGIRQPNIGPNSSSASSAYYHMVRESGLGADGDGLLGQDAVEMTSLEVALRIRNFTRPTIFSWLVAFCVIVDLSFLGAKHAFMVSNDYYFMINIASFVCNTVFLSELMLRFIGLGWSLFVIDPMNWYDFVVVTMAYVEFGLEGTTSVSAFRALRLLRIFKFIRFSRKLRHISRVFLNTFRYVACLSVILVLFLFLCVLLCMQFLYDKLSNPNNLRGSFYPLEGPFYSRANFQTFLSSLYAVLQIFSRDDWTNLLYESMSSVRGTNDVNGVPIALFIIIIFIIGNFVFIPMYLSLFVVQFTADGEYHSTFDTMSDCHVDPVDYEEVRNRQKRAMKRYITRREKIDSEAPEDIIRTIVMVDTQDEYLEYLRYKATGSAVIKETKRSLEGIHYIPNIRPTDVIRLTPLMAKSVSDTKNWYNGTSKINNYPVVSWVRRTVNNATSLLTTNTMSSRSIGASGSVDPSTAIELAMNEPFEEILTEMQPSPVAGYKSTTCEILFRDDDGFELGPVLPCPLYENQRSPRDLYEMQKDAIRLRRSKQFVLSEVRDLVHIKTKSGVEPTVRILQTVLNQLWSAGLMLRTTLEEISVVSEVTNRPSWDVLLFELEEEQVVLDLQVGEEQVGQASNAIVGAQFLGVHLDRERNSRNENKLTGLWSTSYRHLGEKYGTHDKDNTNTETDIIKKEKKAAIAAYRRQSGKERVGLRGWWDSVTAYDSGSLFILPYDNTFREFLMNVVESPIFEYISLFFIIMCCFFLMLYNPKDRQQNNGIRQDVLEGFDVFFTAVFTIEMVLKIIAQGFILGTQSYIRENKAWWNCIDFVVVVISIVTCATSATVLDIRFVKSIRLFRILRITSQAYYYSITAFFSNALCFCCYRISSRDSYRPVNRDVRVVSLTILRSIPALLVGCILLILNYWVWSVIVIEIFHGKLSYCAPVAPTGPALNFSNLESSSRNFSDMTVYSDTGVPTILKGNALFANLSTLSYDECADINLNPSFVFIYTTNSSAGSTNTVAVKQHTKWTPMERNFDHLGNAMLALIEASTGEWWIELLHNGVDSVSNTVPPLQRNYSPYKGLFFVVFFLFTNLVCLRFLGGIVIYHFDIVRRQINTHFATGVRSAATSGKESGSTGYTSSNFASSYLFFTRPQREWCNAQRFILQMMPSRSLRPLDNFISVFLSRVITTGDSRLIYELQNSFHRKPWQKRADILGIIYKAFMILTIMTNISFILLEHYDMSNTYLDISRISNYVFIGIYLFDMLLKVVAYSYRFFTSIFTVMDGDGSASWHWFDLLINVLVLVDLGLKESESDHSKKHDGLFMNFNVFRIIKLLYLMRSFKTAVSGVSKTATGLKPHYSYTLTKPYKYVLRKFIVSSTRKVRIVLSTLRFTFMPLCIIFMFFVILFVVFGIIGFHSFATVRTSRPFRPHGEYHDLPFPLDTTEFQHRGMAAQEIHTENTRYNKNEFLYVGGAGVYREHESNPNFNDFLNSLQLLFRIGAGGEDWNRVMHDVMRINPSCTYESHNCGSAAAPLFFIPFVFLTLYFLTYVLYGVVLESYEAVSFVEYSFSASLKDIKKFIALWEYYDPDATCIIPTDDLGRILMMLPAPLGLLGATTADTMPSKTTNTPFQKRHLLIQKLKQLRIRDHKGFVHFTEVLLPLARLGVGVDFTEQQMRQQEEGWRHHIDVELPVTHLHHISNSSVFPVNGSGTIANAEHHFVASYIASVYKMRIARLYVRRKLFIRHQEGIQVCSEKALVYRDHGYNGLRYQCPNDFFSVVDSAARANDDNLQVSMILEGMSEGMQHVEIDYEEAKMRLIPNLRELSKDSNIISGRCGMLIRAPIKNFGVPNDDSLVPHSDERVANLKEHEINLPPLIPITDLAAALYVNVMPRLLAEHRAAEEIAANQREIELEFHEARIEDNDVDVMRHPTRPVLYALSSRCPQDHNPISAYTIRAMELYRARIEERAPNLIPVPEEEIGLLELVALQQREIVPKIGGIDDYGREKGTGFPILSSKPQSRVARLLSERRSQVSSIRTALLRSAAVMHTREVAMGGSNIGSSPPIPPMSYSVVNASAFQSLSTTSGAAALTNAQSPNMRSDDAFLYDLREHLGRRLTADEAQLILNRIDHTENAGNEEAYKDSNTGIADATQKRVSFLDHRELLEREAIRKIPLVTEVKSRHHQLHNINPKIASNIIIESKLSGTNQGSQRHRKGKKSVETGIYDHNLYSDDEVAEELSEYASPMRNGVNSNIKADGTYQEDGDAAILYNFGSTTLDVNSKMNLKQHQSEEIESEDVYVNKLFTDDGREVFYPSGYRAPVVGENSDNDVHVHKNHKYEDAEKSPEKLDMNEGDSQPINMVQQKVVFPSKYASVTKDMGTPADQNCILAYKPRKFGPDLPVAIRRDYKSKIDREQQRKITQSLFVARPATNPLLPPKASDTSISHSVVDVYSVGANATIPLGSNPKDW